MKKLLIRENNYIDFEHVNDNMQYDDTNMLKRKLNSEAANGTTVRKKQKKENISSFINGMINGECTRTIREHEKKTLQDSQGDT
mgnify:CR=1 FL=1